MRLINSQGKAHPLTGRALSLGRAPDNDVVLQNGRASGRHAVIRPEGSAYIVEDQGSTNGVLVNGERIGGPRTLRNGDRIMLGDEEFTFSDPAAEEIPQTIAEPFHPPAPPPTPAPARTPAARSPAAASSGAGPARTDAMGSIREWSKSPGVQQVSSQIDTNALMKSIVVGIVSGVTFFLISAGASLTGIGVICLCLIPIAYALTGLAYGYFTEQNGFPVSLGRWTLGGAVSGVSAALASTLLSTICLSPCFLFFNTAILAAETDSDYFTQADQLSAFLQGNMAIASFVCFYITIYVVLGGLAAAVGGAVYALIRTPPRQTTAAV